MANSNPPEDPMDIDDVKPNVADTFTGAVETNRQRTTQNHDSTSLHVCD